MKTAIDIVLESVSNGSITHEDAKTLLEAINKQPQIVYDPNRTNNPWYTSTSTYTTTNAPTDNKTSE